MARVLIIDDPSGTGRGLEQSLACDELELRVAPWSETTPIEAAELAPALVILCLAGCAGSAAPRCAALRAEPALDGVTLLVAASAREQDELARCLELGADDALVLPVHPKIAAARVLALTRAKAERESHAELARAAEQGQQAFRTTVDALRRSTEAMEHTERRKRYLETHDGLTGLANRAYFREFARRTMGYARRYGHTLAVLTINLDHFDRVNENLGHATGDQLLQSVAKRLRACVRGSDIVARFGGDDFAVVLTSLSSRDDAALVARKILDIITRPHDVAGGEIYVTPSIGLAIFPDDGETPDGLLRSADVALHRVKDAGRGQFQFYSAEMRGGAGFERMQLEVMLREALDRNEFSLYYQPQVDVGKRELVGAEALIRWHHPERGMISPADFIPLAESNGLIEPIGEWVLRTACAQKRAWERAGLGDFPISVNVSRRQFRVPGIEDKIADDPARDRARPAPPRARDHRERADRGRAADAARAAPRARARRRRRDRRLRHRLLEPGRARPVPCERAQDRPGLRARHRARPRARGDHPRGAGGGVGAPAPGHGRGRRDARGARLPGRARLRAHAGLPVRPARPDGGIRDRVGRGHGAAGLI